MAAPIGNQNAKGHDGSRAGRKTAFGEKADADFLWEMFTQPIDKTDLAKRVATGRHTLLDALVIRGMAGSDKVLVKVFDKLFPDSLNMTANLNQKQMKTLEDNVKAILEVATHGTKKRTIIGSNPERLSASIKAATEALVRNSKKKKKVVKKLV